MTDLIAPKSILDRIAADLVHVRETTKGGIITTPVLFPSGAHVTIRIILEEDRCLITDDGAAFAEADMMGALDIFKRSAKTVADELGIRFNSFEIFEAKANIDTAPGMIAIVADAARKAIHLTSEKLAKRLEAHNRDNVVDRLIEVFGAPKVTTNAIIAGASTHAWTVDALVTTGSSAVAVEIITPSPISVSSSYMKLDDIRRLESAPRTVGALSSRASFKPDQLLILGRAASLIDAKAKPDEFRRLAA